MISPLSFVIFTVKMAIIFILPDVKFSPYAWIITKRSNCHRMSKFGCLFTLSVCFKPASSSIGKLRPQKNNKPFNKTTLTYLTLKQSLVIYNNAHLKKNKINKHPKFDDNFNIIRRKLEHFE